MKIIVIDGGVVTNIIVGDADFMAAISSNHQYVFDHSTKDASGEPVAIGATYDGTDFINPITEPLV